MAYGSINADSIVTSVSGGVLGGGNASIMKNRIINGAMQVAQYTTSAVTVNADAAFYAVDRFQAAGQSSDGVYTIQQLSTAPAGFVNSLVATVTTADSSIGSTQQYNIQQSIEGYNIADLGFGTANAKTVTLSFWVQSSVTGTFSGALRNSAVNRSYPFSYTISAANTWEQKTVTIAGDTTGTWLTNNSTGINVIWTLGAGTSRLSTANSWQAGNYQGVTGQTQWIANSGATFYITGVQLEVGSSATGFEYVNYQTSLANCQRYYWQQSGIASTVTTIGSGMVYATTDVRCSVQNPVTMRTTPTITFTGSAFEYERANLSRGTLASMNSTGRSAESSVLYSGSGTTVATSGDGAIWYLTNSGSNFGVSAEL